MNEDQKFSDCVFGDNEDTIIFDGVPPTKDYIFRKNHVTNYSGVKIMFTGFVRDPETGKPHMINYKKILKFDPDTGNPTMLGEENTLMVKSFFQDRKGRGRMWWTGGGRNKKRHFRKSKKSRRTKRSRSVRRSRNRKGGMLSDQEISEKKDRIKILALTEDKKRIDDVNYRANYDDIYRLWCSLGSEENKKQFEEKFIKAADIFFKDHSYRVPLYKRIIKDLRATDSYNNQHPEDLHMHKSPPSLAVNYRAGGNSSRRRHHRRSSKKYKKACKSHRRVRS